ncbi:MAG TPA: diadenylate cyclase CdaA [Anaerohalosphaeraceae bacterium]|nr:diadenylate cyclase CdaA [Anaerohalosphaeraceae bacterium]HOL30986.1 diadenylate cyclase CdaA [Anaerohalosphaeraceae bacterium]HOM76248.1 diadenylate cyclase CdaA [Anaerohalosphaeraceae bacterium]HPC63369.1 diadenylate cyclase CdaA [Anaerohalosphaeraceae bacterium]HPO69106.1 diadenylate cyclase CdaA [Anaerohalosphaeraceae bacterium]
MKAILEYILNIGFYDRLIVAAELLLIGLFVYGIITFLKGTRGERLFRGMIFVLVVGLLVLNLVVKMFGMDRLAYLYNSFLLVVLVVAVAAFQPELRRGLIRLGQTRLFGSSPQQLTRSVEEIIKAVSQMAADRTGAIIVIPQQVALGEFIETGVRIDAKVTSDLIQTIFYEGTPLHDMAMVIQGDRIVAARVQLPLAEASSRFGQLGSRHRAAIGVTSGSDAIVIVVSEETGIVSLAMEGNLIRNISEAQLRRYLTTALVETTPVLEKLGKLTRTEAQEDSSLNT